MCIRDRFDPNQVLREFTEQFKKRYDVECVSALHHNKTKKNYHIHLIFSERRLLPEPEVKIATRSVFYDELGKRVRTKKEIPGEDGQIREGCIVIKKGEAYEKHLFTAKDEVFKNELFLDEAKRMCIRDRFCVALPLRAPIMRLFVGADESAVALGASYLFLMAFFYLLPAYTNGLRCV